MNKYYLFGAGINCSGVVQFFGRKNIVAVIDSDERKQGGYIEEVPIISLNEYVKHNQGETVIITGFYESSSIADVLRAKGIFNYYISPYMQNGFYENAEDIIEKLKLYECSEIIFCTINPISQWIEQELVNRNNKIRSHYIDRDGMVEVSTNIPIIITNYEDKKILKQLKNMAQPEWIYDINELFEDKFGFRNEKLKRFKDIHKGKRCFVIGNGPSLRYEDLNRLYEHNEICFGANRIYLAYSYTDWRPDYYVAADYMVIRSDSENILGMKGIKFIRHFYNHIENWKKDDIYEFRSRTRLLGKPQLSFDMYEGIYQGYTVVYDAVQIALYMGFDEIYLIGVDMTSGIRCEDEGSHFYKIPDEKSDEVFGKSNIVDTRKWLKYAAETIEKTGRKLRNATRGGELEEVIRVDFDSLF